jgi:hypothetical protein
MAVKDNVLYVDNATDLVAITFDTTNWAGITVSKRIRDILPELSPPDYQYIPWEYTRTKRPKNTVIVGWKEKTY